MQTFLPYESFAESAAVLDQARLGKQRVETLQVLRALLMPTYGWQRHPVVGMWRGFVPALAAYGLAMTDAWIAGGRADTVRPHLLEFAPEVDGVPQSAVDLPSWIGDPAVHESHRSKLITKSPDFYRPLFVGTPEGLEYVWPAPTTPVPEPSGERIWVLRGDADAWRQMSTAIVPVARPDGRATPAWRAQVDAFGHDLAIGATVASLSEDASRVHLGRVTGPPEFVVADGVDAVARDVVWGASVARSKLAVPALLQNPRTVFSIPADHVPVAGTLDG